MQEQEDPVKKFNTTVLALIKRLKQKSRSSSDLANIDRMEKRMASAKRELGAQILVAESSKYFIEYQEQILDRDKYENLILNTDIRAEFVKRNGPISQDNEFFFNLIDSVRGHYNKGSLKEKDEVYVDVNNLFQACVSYKMKGL